MLVQVAARIRGVTRAGDLLARLGGDEFMLLCPDTGARAAQAVAAEGPGGAGHLAPFVEGSEFQLGASIGIAPRPGARRPRADGLLKHADAAMYQTKRAGRDAFTLYSPAAPRTCAAS